MEKGQGKEYLGTLSHPILFYPLLFLKGQQTNSPGQRPGLTFRLFSLKERLFGRDFLKGFLQKRPEGDNGRNEAALAGGVGAAHGRSE